MMKFERGKCLSIFGRRLVPFYQKVPKVLDMAKILSVPINFLELIWLEIDQY